MVEVINIYDYNKNKYLFNKFAFYKSLNKFILYIKIKKIEKNKDIMEKYIGSLDKIVLRITYDFFAIYSNYKKNYFLFKVNAKSVS